MSVPFSSFRCDRSAETRRYAWNDLRRELYPHHAEFWPEDLPEHVFHEQQARELRRRKQREWLRSFFRFRWISACKRFWKKPLWPGSIFENPMEPEKPSDDSRRV